MQPRVAFVATYPPRRCGIATFTRDLASAVGNSEVSVIHPPDQTLLYPVEVKAKIRRDVLADYRLAGRRLSRSVDVVSIQHEFGIFGGADGEHVLALAESLDVPFVVTLHTLLRRPSFNQRRILAALSRRAAALAVMSRTARELILESFDVDPARLRIIPHGVPDLARMGPLTARAELGLGSRPLVLSFGLIGPGKGYELAVEAMTEVRESVPEALYAVVGATHPQELINHGETYRGGLEDLVRALRLEDNILFVNRYLSPAELGRWLLASDVVVTPHPNLEQIVSGTLSYALGAGRPAVSTPFAYAREVLAEGRGLLVPPDSPAALAQALTSLLTDPARRAEMGRRAHELGRQMVWPQVGAAYRELFTEITRISPAADVAMTAVGQVAVEPNPGQLAADQLSGELSRVETISHAASG
jgi:glycosyltransferase involved in cell wall biosynthesis